MPKPLSSPFNVGRRVTFRVAGQKYRGTIVEDRGNIGKGGRRLLRIKILGQSQLVDPGSTVELPAEELTVAR